MNRFWIGLGVLAFLLALGLGITFFMERTHGPISQTLEQASQAALSDDWAQALRLSQQARQQWDACSDFTAAFIDHSMLELAESLFAEVQVYGETGDSHAFAATCAHLSRLTHAIAQSHLPKWQNIL